MQPYDMVMLGVLAVATLWGFKKGMAWQIAALASFGVSYMVALRFSAQIAPHISADAPWNRFLAMLILYVATSFAIWSAFRYISGAISRVQLKEFDRQVGGIFGLAKGVLLCVVVTFFAVTLSDDSRQMVLRSRSGVYIARLLHEAEPVMPAEIHEVLAPYLDRLNHQLDPNNPTEPLVGPGQQGGGWGEQVDRAEEAFLQGFGERFENDPRAPAPLREASGWSDSYRTGVDR